MQPNTRQMQPNSQHVQSRAQQMQLFGSHQPTNLNQSFAKRYSMNVSKARKFTNLSPISDEKLLKYVIKYGPSRARSHYKVGKYRVDRVRNHSISKKRKRYTTYDEDSIIYDIASSVLMSAKKYY